MNSKTYLMIAGTMFPAVVVLMAMKMYEQKQAGTPCSFESKHFIVFAILLVIMGSVTAKMIKS